MNDYKKGSFVTSSENSLGIGKIFDVNNSNIIIEYFDSPSLQKQPKRTVRRDSVCPARLDYQTRVYHFIEEQNHWSVGRIQGPVPQGFYVQFPENKRQILTEQEIYVRWNLPINEPMEYLANQIQESPYFHAGRAQFLECMINQQGISRGMTGLISSVIDLEEHQVEVVRRVLNDPIQRYLLADEVGLGKTIEAGVLIRQYVLDNPDQHRVLILVPNQLVYQWREELEQKFLLGQLLDKTIFVLKYSDINEFKERAKDNDFVVIDEAQHIAAFHKSADSASHEIFNIIKEIAVNARRLLLLSATPVLHSEYDFFLMLHLLDPVVYPIDRIDEFRERVKNRQAVAEIFHAFTEDSPAFFIEKLTTELISKFPNDGLLKKMGNELLSLLDMSGPDNDQSQKSLIRNIRIHVSETYRLNRRILRNRRTQKLEPIVPGRNGLKIMYYEDPKRRRVWELIEEWRIEASSTAGEKGAKKLSEQFRQLLEITSADLSLMKNCLAKKLDTSIDDSFMCDEAQVECSFCKIRDSFNRERYILDQFEAVLEASDDDEHLLKCLVETIEDKLKSANKIVIFCGFSSFAKRVYSYLYQTFGDLVVAHIGSKNFFNLHNNWRKFKADLDCKILVGDRSAEEGINLQGGRTIVIHCNIPFSPNQIEQRMGRVDRYGSGHPVESLFLLEKSAAMHTEWCLFLNKVLKIFDRSIAGLQYVIDEWMKKIEYQLLFEGVDGIVDITNFLDGDEGEIEVELRRINIQDELDSIEFSQDFDPDFFDKLFESDIKWKNSRPSIESWVVDTLYFRSIVDESGKLFRYQFRQSDRGAKTLVPASVFLQRFASAIDSSSDRFDPLKPITHQLSYNRQIAQRKSIRVARLGEPFMNSMLDYIRWDDRGKAFAVWRYRPNLQFESDYSLFFQFEFIIELATENAMEFIKNFDRVSSSAIQRRANSLFPPLFKTIWIDEDLSFLENKKIPNVALEPYRKYYKEGAGRDYNINAERWGKLEDYFDTEVWRMLCYSARSVSEQELHKQLKLDRIITKCMQDASKYLSGCVEQLRSRFLNTHDSFKAEEQRDLELEEGLTKALLDGIMNPLICLDSVGAIFLSDKNPFFEGEHIG